MMLPASVSANITTRPGPATAAKRRQLKGGVLLTAPISDIFLSLPIYMSPRMGKAPTGPNQNSFGKSSLKVNNCSLDIK
jgi:hypothetical protein